MLGFEQTATGYVATAEQVAWWESRDTCPMDDAICEPIRTEDGIHYYRHSCAPGEFTEWTRKV